MNLVYFIILISSLIFVHELGHFMFAKLFGVKVLTFSLGFGPKILRIRGRETEYCVGLLPLGGYVRMLESSKNDIVYPEDRSRTFESLPAYKRIIVVLAGPVMNLLFPILLYFSVFIGRGAVLPPTVGGVLPDHPADGLLHPGDRIMEVQGEEVGTFEEVRRIIERNPAKPISFKVFRDNKYVEVEVVADEIIGTEEGDPLQAASERSGFGIFERRGSVGIESSAPAAVIGISDAESPAYRAGLRTFDVVTHIAGKQMRKFSDLEQELRENHGETIPVSYLRPRPIDVLGGLATMAVYDAGVVALTPDSDGDTMTERTGLELADLYVADVPTDSPLYAAGLRTGDRLLKLDDEELPAWSAFIERVWRERDKPHHIDWLSARDGRLRAGEFQMRREDFTDESGQTFARYRFRVQHWIPLAPDELVEHPNPVRYALTKAVEKTVGVTKFIIVLFGQALQGRVSLDSLSGPITIYEVAGEEGRKGTDNFIWVMALISINLGLLNLLPIPVLDGGHLLFFSLEAILRRSIPLRVREVAHVLGLVVIVTLGAIAFKNDVERRWDAIRSHFIGDPSS